MVRTIEEHQHELIESLRRRARHRRRRDRRPAPGARARSATTSTASRRTFVNCLGYELIHLIDREPPFDPSRRVLDQRGYWFANDIYDKPALATEPMRWEPGFHRTADLQHAASTPTSA